MTLSTASSAQRSPKKVRKERTTAEHGASSEDNDDADGFSPTARAGSGQRHAGAEVEGAVSEGAGDSVHASNGPIMPGNQEEGESSHSVEGAHRLLVV